MQSGFEEQGGIQYATVFSGIGRKQETTLRAQDLGDQRPLAITYIEAGTAAAANSRTPTHGAVDGAWRAGGDTA